MAQRIVIYSDARQQVERELDTDCRASPLMSLPWQAGAIVPLVYRGAIVGLLIAIYREDEMPNVAKQPSWRLWLTRQRRQRQTPG